MEWYISQNGGIGNEKTKNIKSAVLMAFSLVAEPLHCLAAETVALSDAGFEGSILTDGIWNYWLPDGETTANKELVDFSYSSDAWMTPPTNGGSKCLKFYLPAAGSFYFTQELTNAPAGTYTLTAQSMGGAGETVAVVLGDQVGSSVQKDSGFNNWTTSSGTFTLDTSSEKLVVGVYVTCTAGGWGYIDNLALTYEAPEVTEPEATEPEVTEPEATEPEVTDPEVTAPAVTEPEVTEPEVTEPAVTEPEATEPEGTEPENTTPIPVVSDLDVPYIQGTSGDFMRGVDVSSVLSILNSGATFKDWDGNTLDGQGFFNLLAASGINWVRLRVWNDPFNSSGNGYGGGNCDVNAAVTMGKWATNAGMKVLINFHYSDFWADPSKQQAPKAWAGYTADQKAAALESYTYDSLKTLLDAGVNVGMVQVGNETTTGMSGVTAWADLSKLFAAGSKAVRDISSEYGKDILVAIHFTNPETGNYPTYAKNLNDYGIDYDVFASSYYPYWHGTLSNLTSSLKHVADTYGKQVIIAETSWAYTLSDGDGWSNTVQSGTSATYAFSVQGQADEVVAVTQAVRAVGDKGVGIFYWEPAWIPVQVYNGSSSVLRQNKALWEKYGSGWASSYAGEYDPDDAGVWYGGSSWDNQALFDFYGNPLDSLNVYKYMQTGTTDVEIQHSYSVTKSVAPTCTEDGYKVYTCGSCGDSYTETITATGHSYTRTKTVEATCAEDGYNEYTCVNCGDSYTETIVATGEHSYAATETVAATCTEDGHITYACTGCDASYTESIAATGHNYVSVPTEATCETEGYTTHICENCGDSYMDTYVAALGHNYVSVTTKPACKTAGYTTHTCENCGDSYVDSYVAALGHSYVAVTTEATCEADGYTTHTCDVCGDSYVDSYVAALGHTYESVTVDATCTVDGSVTYTCHCGESYVEVIPATGHSYTCEEVDGYLVYTCENCGDSYSEELDTAPIYEQSGAFTTDGQYVITLYSGSKYYALSHEDNKISVVQIYVENGVITSEIDENLLWTYSDSRLSYKYGTSTYYLYAGSSRGWGGFFGNGSISLSTSSSSTVSFSRNRIKVGNYYLRYSNGSVSASRSANTTAYIFTEAE